MKKCKIEERLKIIENKVINIETMLAGSIEYNDRKIEENKSPYVPDYLKVYCSVKKNKEDLHYDSLSHDEKFEYLMRESTRHPIKEEE